MTSIKWLFRLLLTSICLAGFGYSLVTGPPWLIIGLGCLSIYFLYTLFQIPMQVLHEVKDFALSVKYKDFARHFATKKQREEIKILRSSFNEIHDAIKEITREKEAQYQYLQKMLDWIDTGILLYKPESGEVVWMNEALKKLWDIPYLKTIHFLEKRNPKLFDKLVHLGNHSEIYQEENKMLLTGTSFSTDGITFKLIAVKNVNEVLAENEVQSWQKLLSVLTHEIMNSVAPISSLADTLKKRLGDSEDDLAQGIDTIKSRSEGLLKFTAIYRNLNKITTLSTESILVRELFENIYRLMDPTLSHRNIELQLILRQPNMRVIADKALME
jgi:two-component system nitrogen regulation sensor histidine kinase NtrY